MKASSVSPFVVRRQTTFAERSTVAVLLLWFVFQAAVAARQDSVTVDEFVHVPIGLYMLRQHDLTPDPINPPLARMLLALPLWLDPTVAVPPFNANHWGMGLAFMDQNFDRYQSIFLRARCVVIGMALALGLLLYHWARDLDGPASGIVAVVLFAFSPSLLAHGHLATVDLAATLGFAVAVYTWWRYLERRSVGSAVIAGLAAGIAISLKFSSAIILAVVACSAIVEVVAAERDQRLRTLGSLATAIVLLLATLVAAVDAAYGLEGLSEPLGNLRLQGGGPVARLSAAIPGLRLPLPSTFLAGFDLVSTGRDSERSSFYLAGSFSSTGWWYYHLVAFAVKTPLPVLVASALVISIAFFGALRGRSRHCLVLGAVAVFAANAVLNPLNIGVRHVLPAEPLLLVLIAPLFAEPVHAVLSGRRTFLRLVSALLAVFGLGWIAAGTLRIAPRYLEYFNEAAGGPANGRRWLIDSNLDWGQDLVRLARYMDERKLASIPLAYMGTVHPWLYGIHFTPLTRESHGGAAISASTLVGSTDAIWADEKHHASPAPDTFGWLRDKQPAGQIGSMLLFELP